MTMCSIFFRPEAKYIDSVITRYEIYETILRAWIDRERKHNPVYVGDYGEALFEVSLKLAEHMYYQDPQEGKGYIPYLDFKSERVRRLYESSMEEIEVRDHSLLHRKEGGEYRFAHRAFKEFFYAHLLYEGIIPEKDFPFDNYPDVAGFYREMCEIKYFFRQETESRRRQYTPGKLDLPKTSAVFLPLPVRVFCYLQGVDASDPVFFIFTALSGFPKRTGSNAYYLDSFVDIAEYLLKNDTIYIPEDKFLAICDRYGLLPSDLLDYFFFCQTGDAFHFIHRSFVEFFCLFDMMMDTDDEGVREAIKRFPFDRLRFFELFASEIKWLRLRQQSEGL